MFSRRGQGGTGMGVDRAVSHSFPFRNERKRARKLAFEWFVEINTIREGFNESDCTKDAEM